MNASWTIAKRLELLRYGVGGMPDRSWEKSRKTGCLIRDDGGEPIVFGHRSLHMFAVSPQQRVGLVERDMLDLLDS